MHIILKKPQGNEDTLLCEKQEDPRPFTVSSQIGHSLKRQALFDLGSSINTMDLLTFQRIKGLGVKPTMIKIGLPDGKITRPYGVIDDVPIKI